MNILYFVILTVLLVVVLSFLLPWMAKTIEEPFQCPNPNADIPVLGAGPPASSLADYVEGGKQRYNFLNFLHSNTASPALNTDPTVDAVTRTSPLQVLNDKLRSALESVDILPGRGGPYVQPDITLSPTGSATFNNAGAVLASVVANSQLNTAISYVEDRLAPRDDTGDAARCEVTNMHTVLNSAPNSATDLKQARDLAVSRHQLCEMLDPTNRDGPILNAFPDDTTKSCGVCLKDAGPVNPTSVYTIPGKPYNGIGGLFVSQEDINRAEASSPSVYVPTKGSCAPGYFFVEGQQTQCKAAADRLNCEEIAENGFNGGKSLDNTSVVGSNCYACVTGNATKFVYYRPPAEQRPVRVRIAAPSGTGRTVVRLVVKQPDAVSSTSYGAYTLVPTNTNTNMGTTSSDPGIFRTNALYFTIQTRPDDILQFTVYQEFPHRPRGEKEIFFVAFTNLYSANDPNYNTGMEGARIFAESLGCMLATNAQLVEAQTNGMQVCGIGWAADGKKYIVRKSTVTQNPFLEGTETETGKCSIQPDLGGVKEITTNAVATGIWCYGVKPVANYLEGMQEQGAGMGTFDAPQVANFYTYFPTTYPNTVSSADKQSKYSRYDISTQPNVRGVCIQLEANEGDVNRLQPIRVGIEDYLTKVNRSTWTPTTSRAARLMDYSRNGQFGDSLRIEYPKPNSASVFSLFSSNQYWLWSPTNTVTNRFYMEMEVPGYFVAPTYDQDTGTCAGGSGVLHSQQKYLDRVQIPACEGDIDETSIGCLAYLFRYVGGRDTGTLNPQATNATVALNNRKSLVYVDWDATNPGKRLTQKRSKEEILAELQRIKAIMNRTDPSLRAMSVTERTAAINTASQQLLGTDALNPCEELVGENTIAPKQEVDAQCLDYLYRNTIPDTNVASSVLRTSTYSDMTTKYSGLNPGEYTLALPGEAAAFPYKACQPTGSWAPLQNGQENATAVSEIKTAMAALQTEVSNVQKAITVFDTLHRTANSSTAAPEDQALALERCYGVKRKEYKSNCTGVAATTLYFYDLSQTRPTLLGDMTVSAATASQAVVTLEKKQKEPTLLVRTDPVPAEYAPISTSFQFKALGDLYLHSATLTGGAIVTKTDQSLFVTSRSITENARDTLQYIVGIVEHESATSTTRVTKMVSLFFQKQGTELQVKASAKKHSTTATSNADLLTLWSSSSVSIQPLATSANSSGYGIRDVKMGLTAPAYKQASADFSMKSTCTRAGQRWNAAGLSGCSADCCEAYEPYFQVLRNQSIGSITLTGTGIPPKVLVLAKDTNGVLVQKQVAAIAAGSSTTVQFLREDIQPYIPYSDVAVTDDGVLSGTANGTTVFRLESAVGARYFLQSTGAITQLPTTATTATEKTVEETTVFLLRDKISSNLTVDESPIYSIQEKSGGKYLIKGAGDTITSIVKPANSIGMLADWAIEPAINGAPAYVSLQLANVPGYYLVAEPYAGGIRAKAKIIDPSNDVDCFYACWRLYPAA